MISATAPGKIILLGEHAVVYGQPALAIPIKQLYATIQIETEDVTGNPPNDWRDLITISAVDIGRFGTLSQYTAETDPITLVIAKVLETLNVSNPPKCRISIESTIPVASGMGSGAAVSVALARAMAKAMDKELSDKEISEIAFEAEKLHHGTPSGIDNTVITYEKPVFYIKDQPIHIFKVKTPFTLIIADTGIRSSTKETVGDVRKLWLGNPFKYQLIFSQIGEIVEKGRQAIQDGKIGTLGEMMNQDQQLLRELSVSSEVLDGLIVAALEKGAYGAKLSGGGRGGNMITLVREDDADRIESVLLDAGAKRTYKTLVS